MPYNQKEKTEWLRKWRIKNPERSRELNRNYRKRLRMKVINYLGGPICIICGCDIYELLEINHKNLGGRIELRKLYYIEIWRSILKEQRKEEFDIRCKVCNASHYCEVKYGIKHKITIKMRA